MERHEPSSTGTSRRTARVGVVLLTAAIAAIAVSRQRRLAAASAAFDARYGDRGAPPRIQPLR